MAGKMNTRTENINGYIYCAYCGKELKNPCYGICPEPPLICNCEKAKHEMDLYEQLKELYNAPLSDKLIEMKVDEYRKQLTGQKRHTGNTIVTGDFVSITDCYNALK